MRHRHLAPGDTFHTFRRCGSAVETRLAAPSTHRHLGSSHIDVRSRVSLCKFRQTSFLTGAIRVNDVMRDAQHAHQGLVDGKTHPGFALLNDTQRLFSDNQNVVFCVFFLLQRNKAFINVSCETLQSTLTFKLKEKQRLFSLPL